MRPSLRGGASLSLLTDPPGASATLYRYVRQGRRLVPTLVGPLGVTPLRDVPLEHGSYRLHLSALGRADVLYPIQLGRGERWDGVPPGEDQACAVPLPLAGELGPDEVYVPPGWFWSGDHATQLAGHLPRRRLRMHGFVIQRFPVTHAMYLAFVNALLDLGREEEALRYALREQDSGVHAYGRAPDGHFELKPDAHGDAWSPDWPAFLIDWDRAQAYAAWRSEVDGLPWRLPAELEWEKAARGVDGRLLPWGNSLEPTWANIRSARPGRPMPAPVREYPDDESPYSVRGLSGGVTDWCLDAFLPTGPATCGDRGDLHETLRQAGEPAPLRSLRGGAFAFTQNGTWLGRRDGSTPTFITYVHGFRMARTWST